MKHEIAEEQIRKGRELKELREKVSHCEKVSQSALVELKLVESIQLLIKHKM
jgi:hypothetical protein